MRREIEGERGTETNKITPKADEKFLKKKLIIFLRDIKSRKRPIIKDGYHFSHGWIKCREAQVHPGRGRGAETACKKHVMQLEADI